MKEKSVVENSLCKLVVIYDIQFSLSFEKGVSFLQSLFLLYLFMINSVLQNKQTNDGARKEIYIVDFFIGNNCAKSMLTVFKPWKLEGDLQMLLLISFFVFFYNV